jgi:hypothetical protein
MNVLYSTNNYDVIELEESLPIEQSGMTLYFHYGTFNTTTNKIEGYSQFLPNAIDQAIALDEALTDLMSANQSETEGNVVPLNR